MFKSRRATALVKSNDENTIVDYMRFVKICMKVMAMLPIFDEDHAIIYKFANISYIFWVNFVSVHIFVFSAMDLVFSWDGNLFNATYNLINTLIYATNTLLLFYFQFYNNDLIKLMKKLDSTFIYKSAEGLTRLNMRASFEKARLYSIIFTIACLLGALHWAVEPLFAPEGVRSLPLKIWYPVNVMESPFYELAYITQFFGQVMVAIVFSNFGIFFMSECVLICGQFDILCCSLRNLRYTAMIKGNFSVNSLVRLCGFDYYGNNKCTLPEDEYGVYFSGHVEIMDKFLEKSIEDQDSEDTFDQGLFKIKKNIRLRDAIVNCEYLDNIMVSIKDCVVHHQMILEYCAEFETFCSPISLVKMIQITLLACFVMYAFSVSFQIPVLEYGSLTVTDLFLLCYFGNEVMLRSGNVAVAVGGGPWQLLGSQHLKSLLPLITRSIRPVCFTGGKFYTLTLENYIAVLKVSFSYFTVLRNINESQSA